MLILSQNDIFQVKRQSLIADYDKETIFNLYQPLIGSLASALYMTLLGEAKNQRLIPYTTHEELFIKMQITTQEFLKARGYLEAVGLLRTYIEEKSQDVSLYRYEVFAPKTPKAFFDDVLLYGMLIKYIGERSANRLQAIYHEEIKEEKGSEVSKTFGGVFHPDFSDDAFNKAMIRGNNRGRKTAKIDFEFNYEHFFEALAEISQIGKNSLTKKEMKEIERLSTLYGVDEVIAANVVNSIYDSSKEKGNRVNSKKLSDLLGEEANYSFLTADRRKNNIKNKVTSESQLAEKINYFESVTPFDYLSALQGGNEIAKSDKDLINTISEKFHLPPSVINVLLDFVLQKNNNVLSLRYCEKVAASLAREGVGSALDAMNYLNKVNSTSRGNQGNEIKKSKILVTENEPKENKEEAEVSWDELITRLSKGGEDEER